MPYKDSEQKKKWEQKHRSERLARRRELRQIEAARIAAYPEAHGVEDGRAVILLPLIAGGALAAYSPKLAIGAGGLTMCVAALYKKDWTWWFVGVVLLVCGLFFQWSSQSAQEPRE